MAMKLSVVDWRVHFAREIAGKKSSGEWNSYFPVDADNTSSPRPRRGRSIPRRLIFWLRVERGMRKRSAASGLVPSRALQHINNDTTLDLVHDLKQGRLWMSAEAREPGSPGSGGRNSESCRRTPRTFPCWRMLSGSRSASTRSCVERTTARSTTFFQFAHVARPVVIHHELSTPWRELPERLAVFMAIPLEEVGQ